MIEEPCKKKYEVFQKVIQTCLIWEVNYEASWKHALSCFTNISIYTREGTRFFVSNIYLFLGLFFSGMRFTLCVFYDLMSLSGANMNKISWNSDKITIRTYSYFLLIICGNMILNYSACKNMNIVNPSWIKFMFVSVIMLV